MTAPKILDDQQLADAGVRIEHLFGDEGRSTTYIKRTTMPAGTRLHKHKHSFDHHSVVASGFVTVFSDGEPRAHGPGEVILIRAGVEHSVAAITDAVWLCIHGTSETDPARIDHTLVEGGA